MSDKHCKWVRDRFDDLAAESLGEGDLSMMRVHLSVCEGCSKALDIWAGVGRAAHRAELPAMDAAVERRILEAARYPRPERLGRKEFAPKASWGRPLFAAAGALAAACVALFVFGGPFLAPEPPVETPSLRAEDATRPAGTPSRDLAVVTTRADGRTFLEVFPGTGLWLDGDAPAPKWEIGADGVRFELDRGFAVAEIGPWPEGLRFIVETPTEEIEARGTVFSIHVDAFERTEVRVSEGTVEMRSENDGIGSRVLRAGDEADSERSVPGASPDAALFSDLVFIGAARAEAERPLVSEAAARTTARPSTESEPSGAAALMSRAAVARRERRFDEAAANYKTVIAKFPKGEEAKSATVALGQLDLCCLGDPADALFRFESYLAENLDGALAEEAHAGMARALARKGDVAGVERAAGFYLERHPNGRMEAEMTRRLGDCAAARRDRGKAKELYERVVATWPGTREAEKAKAGIDALDLATP